MLESALYAAAVVYCMMCLEAGAWQLKSIQAGFCMEHAMWMYGLWSHVDAGILLSLLDMRKHEDMEGHGAPGLLWAKLAGPLQDFMLPRLPARMLATLRQTSRALCNLIDVGTG